MLPACVVPEMTLDHYKDVHFDLVVSKKSRIFQNEMKEHLGSECESEDETKQAAGPPKKSKTSDEAIINELRKEHETLKRQHRDCLKQIDDLKEEVNQNKKKHGDDNKNKEEEEV